MIFVDGKMFLIRGGEVHNSSSCRLDYMEREGYACGGDSVEITLIDSGFTNDTEKYITELQIPVKKLDPPVTGGFIVSLIKFACPPRASPMNKKCFQENRRESRNTGGNES